MPGFDPQVAMHRLIIDPAAKLVKQHRRLFRLEIMEAIEIEVKKLIDFRFVKEKQHPNWVANIVHVTKKNRKN